MEKIRRTNGEDDEDLTRNLLPGFRFHPTEEELVVFYLRRKVERKPFKFDIIEEVDLYSYDPWDLPGLARIGEREWFFFVSRDRCRHRDGRPNRITISGYWKATGTDRRLYTQTSSDFIALKKTLVFYQGRAPKGEKTEWIMNEYRLANSDPPPTVCKRISKNEFTLCRVYKKVAGSITSFDRRPRIEVRATLPFRISTPSKSGSVSVLDDQQSLDDLQLHAPTAGNQLHSTITKQTPEVTDKRNLYASIQCFSDPGVEKTFRRKASCIIPNIDEKDRKKISLSSTEQPNVKPPKLESSEISSCSGPCLTHANSFESWYSELISSNYAPSTLGELNALDSLWDISAKM